MVGLVGQEIQAFFQGLCSVHSRLGTELSEVDTEHLGKDVDHPGSGTEQLGLARLRAEVASVKEAQEEEQRNI